MAEAGSRHGEGFSLPGGPQNRGEGPEASGVGIGWAAGRHFYFESARGGVRSAPAIFRR